ncbi:PQQ-binding-like beta-propeller repeat protein, partial [bacterium]|nr:PQQ-binding-like beta-propeller repeat protein [bacterium]
MKRLGIVLFTLFIFLPPSLHAQDAKQLITESGITGGLIVHLGCGDGALTADLRADESFIVHGLAMEESQVNQARETIKKRGLYGEVAVEQLTSSHLPYADNLVNLLLVDNPGRVSKQECMRVLAPKGVLMIKQDGKWKKTVKPRPASIDEWTHHLHNAGGNPVASDRVAGPPQHLQWTAGPKWARSHGWTPSVSAMVSSGGRLFYICDEAVAGMDATVPGKWFLEARDAFSGVLLWKKPIPKWDTVYHSGLTGNGGRVSNGRFCMPQHIAKRLVAIGDTVYVTLGVGAPISALDAATGKVKQTYPESANADEFVYTDGRLVMTINPPWDRKPAIVEKGETPPPAPGKQIAVIDTTTGKRLWKQGAFPGIRSSRGQDPFGRLELAAGDGKVFTLTPQKITCLDVVTGDVVWSIPRPALPDDAVRKLGFAGVFEYLLVVMVYHDGVVLLAQPEPNTHHTYHTMPGTLYAFNAANGEPMWSRPYGGWGHCTQPDVFVVDDTVWTHVFVKTEYGHVWGNGLRAKDSSRVDYKIQGLDLKTGERVKQHLTKDI